MKKVLFVLAAAAIALSCQPTKDRLDEPNRTFFYNMCLQTGFVVSQCFCHEQKVVEKRKDVFQMNQVDWQIIMDECNKEQKDVLDEVTKWQNMPLNFDSTSISD
jgi:hypothetical protein